MTDPNLVYLVRERSLGQLEKRVESDLKTFDEKYLLRPTPIDGMDLFEHARSLTKVSVRRMSHPYLGRTLETGEIELAEHTFLGMESSDPEFAVTLPHELGHVSMKHHLHATGALDQTSGVILFHRVTIKRRRDPEWQARNYSYMFVMPRLPTLEIISGTDGDPAVAISRFFRVPLQAAQVRVRQLQIAGGKARNANSDPFAICE